VIANVQHELRRLDLTVVIQDVKTFEQIRNSSIAPQLFAMRLLTGFSGMAAVVAAIGVYGVLSLSVVSRRRRELAIRIPVGAQQPAILGLVLGQALKLVGVGLMFGTAAALALVGFLRALLFGIGPTDPLTFAGALSNHLPVDSLQEASVVSIQAIASEDHSKNEP
jgi:putative ABC transport system permease protein